MTVAGGLLRSAQSGKPAALDQLLARYYGRVLAAVRIRMGPQLRREMDSMDLVQESFVDAVKAFDRFDVQDEASLIRWLRTIVENRVRDAGRHAGRARRDRSREQPLDAPASADTPSAASFDPADPSTLPLDHLLGSEDSEALAGALDGLSESDRELILLRDYEQHSWAQVAEVTWRPTADSARTAHRKAMARLALRMAGPGSKSGDGNA